MDARSTPRRLTDADVVVVAGGGVCGLAFARAMTMGTNGARVVVLARDGSARARRQGYGMTLSETNASLEGLGVKAACRARNATSTAHWTFARDGRILGYYGNAFTAPVEVGDGDLDGRGDGTAARGGGNLRVPRSALREIFLEMIPPATVRWGAEVSDYVEGEDGVTVTLESGETVEGTILVIADGARSSTRRAPGAGDDVKSGELRYLGVALVTGFTDLDDYLLKGRGFYTVDGRSRMFTMPFRAANEEAGTPPRSMWQLSVRVSEDEAKELADASNDRIREFVLKHTKGWHDPISAMFDCTDWNDAWAGPLYDREEPPTSKSAATEKPHLALRSAKSRVICIGDAAHPMSPFKGQGANTALFDAWALSKWLQKAPPQTALACFHREMVARAFVKVRASREACEYFHNPNILSERVPEFAGVDPMKITVVLDALAERGVTASMRADIEPAVKEIIDELDAAELVRPYAAKKIMQRGKEGGVEV